MSQTCAVLSCKRPSCALCHCCQENICLSHLKEHQDLLVSQLNPMVDQINTLGDRLKALNIENKITDARKKLEEWRAECHQKIDRFFKQKCRELDQKVAEKTEKQREEIGRIQSKAAELIREEHATRRDLDLLTSTINDLEREMNKIEGTSFNIRSQSLEIDDNWITIEELGGRRVDLPTLPAVYKTIRSPGGSWVVAASNDRFLLMHEKPNLCLVDQTLTIVKQVLWNDDYMDDYMDDMCWSSVLDRFIMVNKDNIFLVDQSKLSVEKIAIVEKKEWYSCTCSDVSLYLSTNRIGSSLMEYSLLPSIKLIKHWKSPDTCQKNENIGHMRYANETLALLIINSHTKAVHIELRTLKTLQQLWSLRLEIEDVQGSAFCCYPINEDEWLVADHETSRLIHITGDGRTKARCAYNPVPWFPCMFSSDVLVIITGKGINFHKF